MAGEVEYSEQNVKAAARELRETAKLHISSVTIRNALKYRIVKGPRNTFRIVLYTEYYWTEAYLKGRKELKGRRSHDGKRRGVYVWFKNPKRNDPRIKGRGYPKRRQDRRRLTRAQFKAGKALNKRRGRTIMHYQQTVRATRGVDFWKEAFGPRGGRGRQIIRKAVGAKTVTEMKKSIRAELKSFLNLKKAIARI